MQKQKFKSNETQGQFEIKAQVNFISSESNPETNYFFFSYKIKITNHGSTPAQLMSRHWIITDGTGHIEEVRGAGVVGAQPKIAPGGSFEYESACPLCTSSGSMRGTYQLLTDDGHSFDAEIPEFYLIAPSALH